MQESCRYVKDFIKKRFFQLVDQMVESFGYLTVVPEPIIGNPDGKFLGGCFPPLEWIYSNSHTHIILASHMHRVDSAPHRSSQGSRT